MNKNKTSQAVQENYDKRDPQNLHSLDAMLAKYLKMEAALKHANTTAHTVLDFSPLPLAVIAYVNEICIKSGEALSFDPLNSSSPNSLISSAQ